MNRKWIRLLALILAVILAAPLCFGRASAAESQTGSLTVDQVAEVIEPQIRQYAASINQSSADTTAAADLATHGMTGRGKTLKMDASDALTAAIMNSELVMEGFASNLAYIIHAMQRLDMKSIPRAMMSFSWHGADSRYYAIILNESQTYPDNLDWLVADKDYNGNKNTYDKSLEWMIGDCYVYVDIACVVDKGHEKTYQIKAVFDDRFDFHTAKTSGFKKLLSGLGMLLFKEFDWTCTVSFSVTVPYSYENCNHKSGSYRWIYENETITCVVGDGFGKNETNLKTYTVSDGTKHRYYALDKTIRLLHDKPWVIEYDAIGVGSLVLAPVDNAVTKSYPMLHQNGRTQINFRTKEYTMVTNPDTGKLDRYYAYENVGTQLRELFPLASGRAYTYCLENVPDGKGSNQIYLTVTDKESGELCLDRIPMNDYYYDGTWTEEMTRLDPESEALMGKDIFINYIGYRSNGLKAKWMDLRIWEEGREIPGASYFTEKEVESTCTEDGYLVRTCSRCGYSGPVEKTDALGHDWVEADCLNPRTCARCAVTEGKPAGHSFSEWETVTASACGQEGIRVRSCHCGAEETETLPALEHSYEKGSCTLCGEMDPDWVPGDVDGNGVLNYSDALSVLRYSIGLEELENPALADVNDDGNVNYADALQILRTSIGL